ncbi:MAG: hypothetical protein IKP00_01190 [Victivallales bacterium]|nr:hypothetical protein [Victivallales bacterium]
MMRRWLLLMAFCLISFAGEAEKLLKQGNNALNEEKYDDALSLYDKALVESPENPYLIFNKGVAYFKQGEYEKAMKEYKLAVEKLASQKRGDSALEARAFASMGNACFLQAKPLLESNLDQASALCLGAVAAFDEALRIRPEDAALLENRKAARMLLKKILGIKYMQAKEQQKQQEMAQKLKELAERQKQAADETAQQKPDVQKQEQLNQETQELMEQMSGQNQPQPQQQDPQQQQNPIQEAMQQARQAQDDATQNLKENQLPAAEAKQREAAEKLEEALKQGQQQQQQQQQNQEGDDKQEQDKDKQEQEKEGDDKQEQEKDKQDDSEEQQQQQEQNEQEAQENKEEPKEDAQEAQEIIDRERQDKKEREQGEKRNYRAVPMDW